VGDKVGRLDLETKIKECLLRQKRLWPYRIEFKMVTQSYPVSGVFRERVFLLPKYREMWLENELLLDNLIGELLRYSYNGIAVANKNPD